MAWRSSLVVAALLAIAPGPAAAEYCDSDIKLSFFTTRFSIVPSPGPDDGIGLDLWSRGPSATWRGRCGAGGLHRIDGAELDAPDYGDDTHMVWHFLSYSYAWRAGAVTLVAGAHALTSFGENLRFLTPVLGVTVEPDPELVFHAQLESFGLFAFATHDAPLRPLDDAAVVASAVWPASKATRGEVRVRARRYRFEDGVRRRDLLLSAGVGLAFAAWHRQRALPGFLGLAVRAGDEVQLLVVAELEFGIPDR